MKDFTFKQIIILPTIPFFEFLNGIRGVFKMEMLLEIPINSEVASVFIGYMYHYLKSNDYMNVISLKSLEIGAISGFVISNMTIVVTFITHTFFNIIGLLTDSILIILSIILVVVGELSAIAVKNIIIAYNQRRL
jgi:hypothetical protein